MYKIKEIKSHNSFSFKCVEKNFLCGKKLFSIYLILDTYYKSNFKNTITWFSGITGKLILNIKCHLSITVTKVVGNFFRNFLSVILRDVLTIQSNIEDESFRKNS